MPDNERPTQRTSGKTSRRVLFDPSDSHDACGVGFIAARICGHATAGQIVASRAVRDRSIGKPFGYHDLGDVDLKGFQELERLFAVAWT